MSHKKHPRDSLPITIEIMMLESRNSKRMMGTNIETTSYDANKIRALIAGLWNIHYWYAKSTITRKMPIFFIYRRYILVRTVTQHSNWTSMWSPLAVTTAIIHLDIIKWLIIVFLGVYYPTLWRLRVWGPQSAQFASVVTIVTKVKYPK